MKIFLSYKQGGVPEKELNENLAFLRGELKKLNIKNFIYYLDEDSNLKAEEINKIVLENIKNSDLVLGFINHKEKSEGELLELGISFALNKKIILLVNNKFKDNYFLSYGINAEIIYFNKLKDINFEKIEF